MTRDHSHIIFKIDNPLEQKVFDINEDINWGDLILGSFTAGNVCGNWFSKVWGRHCHARSVVPNNPKNIAASDGKGKISRGTQYPVCDPTTGNYHEL